MWQWKGNLPATTGLVKGIFTLTFVCLRIAIGDIDVVTHAGRLQRLAAVDSTRKSV
jgi:hypothetical protein